MTVKTSGPEGRREPDAPLGPDRPGWKRRELEVRMPRARRAARSRPRHWAAAEAQARMFLRAASQIATTAGFLILRSMEIA